MDLPQIAVIDRHRIVFDTKDQVSSILSLSCYLLLFLVCNYSEHDKVSRGWLLISLTLSIGGSC